jgi:hypothetical protein
MRNAAVFFCFCKISSSVQVYSSSKKLLYHLGHLVEITNHDVLKYHLLSGSLDEQEAAVPQSTYVCRVQSSVWRLPKY